MLIRQTVTAPDFRDAMSRVIGAVHVVTTDGAAGRRGVTVTSACSVSDDPPTVLVCLNRAQPLNNVFFKNGRFCMNTLSAGQEDLSAAFSGQPPLSQEKRFGMAEWDQMATGAPVLKNALASFDCEIVDSSEIATHSVVIGRVRAVRFADTGSALVYHDRVYLHHGVATKSVP